MKVPKKQLLIIPSGNATNCYGHATDEFFYVPGDYSHLALEPLRFTKEHQDTLYKLIGPFDLVAWYEAGPFCRWNVEYATEENKSRVFLGGALPIPATYSVFDVFTLFRGRTNICTTSEPMELPEGSE